MLELLFVLYGVNDAGITAALVASMLVLYSTEGVIGLYRGFIPNLLRNSIMCMTELATYDVTKQALLTEAKMTDGLVVHALSGKHWAHSPAPCVVCSFLN